MKNPNLDFIIGNQHVERAIEIAYASEQTLLIIGNLNTQAKEIAERLIEKRDHPQLIFYWQPCPCGFSGHPSIPCECSVSTIKKHLLTKPFTDMEVEISDPPYDAIEKRIKVDLDNQSKKLLKTAYKQLNLGYQGLYKTIERAQAIAKLGKYAKIKAEHIAEAIQYQSKK